MLILRRRLGESIKVGPDMLIQVRKIKGEWVELGITAPEEWHIDRVQERVAMPEALHWHPDKPR